MSPILPVLVVVSLLLGAGIGWLLGRARGKRDLAFYKAGVEETLKGGRYCWVRSQIPPDQN